MALLSWPAELPQRPLIDFSEGPVSGLNDADEARNPQRTRTFPVREAAFRFVMTLEQVIALRTFFNVTTNDGCVPFAAPWLGLIGLPGHWCRMLQGPKWTPLGGRWFRAEITVEIMAGAAALPGLEV